MVELFTCGRWQVTASREDEFVAAWREFAERIANMRGLLEDFEASILDSAAEIE